MTDPNTTLLKAVTTLTDEVTKLTHKVETLETKIDETKEIVEAWGAVKTLGKFLKWAAGVLGAAAVIAATVIWAVKASILHIMGR